MASQEMSLVYLLYNMCRFCPVLLNSAYKYILRKYLNSWAYCVDLVSKLKLLQTSILRADIMYHQLSVKEYTIPSTDIRGEQW
jgi:hypothetical protein